MDDSLGDGNRVVTMEEFRDVTPRGLVDRIPRDAACYVSVDVDVLDLPLVPGCVSAEPNGFLYAELRDTLRALAEHTRIVGFDLVEVNPMLDIGTGITSYLAAHTIVEFLGWLCAQPWWIAGRDAREAARAGDARGLTRRAVRTAGCPDCRGSNPTPSLDSGPSRLSRARRTSDHDRQRGGSVMPKKRNGVSRREFIRDAALLSGGLAAVDLPGTARAQGTGAPPPKLGAQLIGKLEGPELILDPAKWPKKFSEAPMLAELVKQGKLPPVEQRVPEEPLVIKPVHEIGSYGGTWRRGFTGPGDGENGNRIVSSDKLLFWDYTGTKVMPCVAASGWLSDDGKSVTLYLRKGMKWSDGQPFTADDFVFWFEDIYLNKDIVPTPHPGLHGQRQVRASSRSRRDHGALRVPGAELPVRGHPGRVDRDGRRPGALADDGPRRWAPTCRRTTSSSSMPKYIGKDAAEREGEGGRLRQLGAYIKNAGTGAQPRAAGPRRPGRR